MGLKLGNERVVRITPPVGLSLGDRACLALGIQRAAHVLTADKVWLNLDITGLQVELLR